MNSIEKTARDRHGDLQYDLTWKARNEQNLSKKNWLWTLLALRVLLVSYGIVALIWYCGYLITDHLVGVDGWVWLIFATPMAILIEGFFYQKRSISKASSFYSIAADMKRTNQRGRFPKLLFYFSGGMSLLLAMFVVAFSSHRLHKLSSTDLDVLGSIFSKAGCWNMAKEIYKIIQQQYVARVGKSPDVQMQLSISFGLACKWMIGKPAPSDEKQKNRDVLYRSMMMDVVREYPKMPPEVAMRFREALGPLMDEALNPIKDARSE